MVVSVNEAPLETFHEAIRATHGAKASLVARERVEERFEGQPVWTGEVLVFELGDHPRASLCYAWEVDGEVTAVLGVPPVKSARDAVRASIMAAEDDGSVTLDCSMDDRYGE